jgi:hypothetical protein
VIAAPVAAWLVSKAPQRLLGILVGNFIVFLNVRQLIISLELNATISVVLFSMVALVAIAALVVGLRHLKTDHASDKNVAL